MKTKIYVFQPENKACTLQFGLKHGVDIVRFECGTSAIADDCEFNRNVVAGLNAAHVGCVQSDGKTADAVVVLTIKPVKAKAKRPAPKVKQVAPEAPTE